MKKIAVNVFWVALLAIVLYAAKSFYDKNKTSTENAVQIPQVSSRDAGAEKNSQKQAAPEISLKDLGTKFVKLSDYKGKVVFLNFWASWCPPCKAEMPELNEFSKELSKGNEAILLTINLTDGGRETVEKANRYIRDNGFSMNVLLDTEGKAGNDYHIASIPSTFIIDKDGFIVDSIVGGTTKNALMNYLNQLK